MSGRCLVLGASGALGSAIARVLSREGCQLALTYHQHPEGLPDLPGSLRLACDLRSFEGVGQCVNQAAEGLGGLDALVQAAGVSGEAFFFQSLSSAQVDRLGPITQAAFDELLEVNARGSFAACQAAAPFLKASGGGNIVLIGAIDGIKPVPSPVHFATSQAALKGMTESLARELGHHNIRVNLMALGMLERAQLLRGGCAAPPGTPPLLRGGCAAPPGTPPHKVGAELKQAYLAHCSLGRLGTCQEVAEAVAWMALENSYVTGQTLVLDGGL